MASTEYYPGEEWERIAPEYAGFDPEKLKSAVSYCMVHETPWGRDLSRVIAANFYESPEGMVIGPTRERGGPNGLIVRGGADRRRVGGHRARRYDFQRFQELSLPVRRTCL